MPCNANVGVLFSKELPHQPIRRLLRTYRDNFSSFLYDEPFTAFHAMCCMTPGLSYCTRIRSFVHNASGNEDGFLCVTKRTVGAFGCHEKVPCKCSTPAQCGTMRHNAAQCGTMRHNAVILRLQKAGVPWKERKRHQF